jgi:hypothetical protein
VDPPPYTPNPDFPLGGDFNLDITSPWSFGFPLCDALNLSPISSDAGTGSDITPAAPSLLNTPSSGQSLLRSVPHTLRNNRQNGRRTTRGTRGNMAHSQPSLRERFADVINRVRQLPPGDKPKNALFTPFFTREDDHYTCLLCRASDPKVLANRTQIIQHIAGHHGGYRPFACLVW